MKNEYINISAGAGQFVHFTNGILVTYITVASFYTADKER
jgi:hypothetical protein